MGKIVIGTDIGGIPEILPRDLLVKPGDAHALAERIAYWFTKDDAYLHKWGKMVQAQVRAHNDSKKYLQSIVSLYSKS
jgi:glycosyltransferase involved in cell wall biosynthesis